MSSADHTSSREVVSDSRPDPFLLLSISTQGTATYIDRGTAADIWLVETPDSKYILKQMRLSAENIPTSRLETHDGQSGTTQLGVRSSTDNPAEQFIQEFRTKTAQWMNLHHQNIVKIFGIGDNLDLRVEFCSNGTARQYLDKRKGDPQTKLQLIEQVLLGVKYLHTHDPAVVHGCLQMDKIFVTEDGTAKVGEFGLSLLTSSFAMFAPAISLAGLSRWMSPELVESDTQDGRLRYTTASDMWALGCTLLEVIAWEMPYKQFKRELGVRRAIVQGKKPGTIISAPGDDFQVYRAFMAKCWEAAPGDRPIRPETWPIRPSNVSNLSIKRTGLANFAPLNHASSFHSDVVLSNQDGEQHPTT